MAVEVFDRMVVHLYIVPYNCTTQIQIDQNSHISLSMLEQSLNIFKELDFHSHPDILLCTFVFLSPYIIHWKHAASCSSSYDLHYMNHILLMTDLIHISTSKSRLLHRTQEQLDLVYLYYIGSRLVLFLSHLAIHILPHIQSQHYPKTHLHKNTL